MMRTGFIPMINKPLVSQPRFGGQKALPANKFEAERFLLSKIKQLGPEYLEMDMIDRWYEDGDTSGYGYQYDYANKVIFFDMHDGRTVKGMTPQFMAELVKRIPELKPASEAVKELKEAGYILGFPTPRTFEHHWQPKDTKPGDFAKNTYAFTYPGKDGKSPQTFLIVANIDYGDYHDKLSYLEAATSHLERRLRSWGDPQAEPSLQLSNYPGFEPGGNDQSVFGNKPTLKILLPYENPVGGRRWSREEPLRNAIKKLPELIPADKMKKELLESGIDGYYRRGEYTKDMYALDLHKLQGFKADPQYPRYIVVNVYNESKACIVKPGEKSLKTLLDKLLQQSGMHDYSVSIATERGPDGPNYLSVSYNAEKITGKQIRAALAKIPQLTKTFDSTNSLFAQWDLEYNLDASSVPALQKNKLKQMPVKVQGYVYDDGYGNW
jgi:hypothetical protein